MQLDYLLLALSKKDIFKKIPNKRSQLEREFEEIEFFEDISEKKLIEIFRKIDH